MAITIVVGLGSALLGAVAGFLGAVFIERLRLHRTRQGMIRAVIGELRGNATALIQAGYSGRSDQVHSTDTWKTANFELAQFLDQKLYEDVLFQYMTLPKLLSILDRRQLISVPGEYETLKELFKDWLDRNKKVMTALNGKLPKELRFHFPGDQDAEPSSTPTTTSNSERP